ncbi:hypothetical protein CBL_13863 [Carabus blaptoides fortunei]
MSNNPLTCSQELRELVDYLYSRNVQNAIYVTHENQNFNFDERQNYANGWKQVVLKACKESNDEYDMNEFDEEILEDEFEEQHNMEIEVVRNTINIAVEEQPREMLEEEHLRYSYMWPVLVFTGTALVVLAIVTNLILFVIRRRQALHVPTIIAGGIVPRLKKNSGLVYQPLSEEHGPKTPILSRFVPGAATAPCDPENNI